MDLYSGFRFTPSPSGPNAGLVPNANESWTQEYFQLMQSSCAAHGVTIIPEIDTPGHSLEITKWKPDLMLAGQPDLLDLSNPDTLPTVQSIWTEFLPWFTSQEVSIGADEYEASLADEYITFVNNMADFFAQQSGKSMRVWGTYEPSPTMSISQNVTIQHWNFPADSIPVQLMQQGYSIINSEMAFLYLDGKTSTADGQLPWELDQDLIWGGAPGGTGWAPNIFSQTDASNNTSADNPLLRGSIMALWNDWGNNASTQLEEYYQLARSFAVFAEKSWAGSGIRSTALTRDQFDSIYPVLNAIAPGQNLNRVVAPQSGNTVFAYDQVPNLPFLTNVTSVGPPYTFTFTVTPSASAPLNSTIFTGFDSALHIDGLSFRDIVTNDYFPLGGGYTLPLGQSTTVEIHATRNYTYAIIDGMQYTWTSLLSLWGEPWTKNMSFAAPSLMFGGGGFEGQLANVTLSLGA
jgi:hexosaminidase